MCLLHHNGGTESTLSLHLFLFFYISERWNTRDAAGGTSTETVGRKQGCAVKKLILIMTSIDHGTT